jgi:hypothetical protein
MTGTRAEEERTDVVEALGEALCDAFALFIDAAEDLVLEIAPLYSPQRAAPVDKIANEYRFELTGPCEEVSRPELWRRSTYNCR